MKTNLFAAHIKSFQQDFFAWLEAEGTWFIPLNNSNAKHIA